MAGLPDISLEDTKAEVSMEDMREAMDEVLSDKDQKIIYYFFLQKDCLNIAELLANPQAKLAERGNMTQEQYVDLYTSATEMNFNVHRYPAFLSEFVRNYAYNKDKAGYFPKDEMLYQFYKYAIETCPCALARRWYQLNLDITNILTAMLARKNGWNVADFIHGENEVTDMILNNNTKDFNLSFEYDYVPDLMRIVDCDDPVLKEKKIDAFKWLWLDEQTFFDSFSIDAVFAYLCKIDMLARWDRLDVEQGQQAFRQIIDDLRGSAKVPDEFIRK